MDATSPGPGYSLALPDRPASPWLRLAHRWDPPPALCPGVGLVRTLKDFEFFLVLRGASWLWLADQDAHVPLPSGSLALIPPGLVHAYGETRCTHIAVHADLHAQPSLGVPAMMRLDGRRVAAGRVGINPTITLRWGVERIAYPLVQPLADPVGWERRFAPLLALYGSGTQRSASAQLVAAGILAAAFAEVWQGRAPADPVARVLAEVAAEHPARRHPLAELARRTGLGDTAFRAAVRRLTGTTPQAHLEQLRLERAAHLLASTSLPVLAVAEAVGYDDAFHFSRAFRRRHGHSPSRWRAGPV